MHRRKDQVSDDYVQPDDPRDQLCDDIDWGGLTADPYEEYEGVLSWTLLCGKILLAGWFDVRKGQCHRSERILHLRAKALSLDNYSHRGGA